MPTTRSESGEGGGIGAPLGPRSSSVDACARHLRDAIVRGEIVAGSFLPPERILAARLGINRTTLRAAIHRLAESGLLEAQQGRGTLVKDFRAHASVEVVLALDDDAATPAGSLDLASLARDLLAVRRAIARVVLEALVESPPGDAAIAAITTAIDRLEATARSGAPVDRLAAADLEVLSAVVEATGRPGLRLCMNPIARTLASLPRLAAAIYVDPADDVASFRAIVPFLAAPRADLVEPLVAVLAARDAATLARLPAPAAPQPPAAVRPAAVAPAAVAPAAVAPAAGTPAASAGGARGAAEPPRTARRPSPRSP